MLRWVVLALGLALMPVPAAAATPAPVVIIVMENHPRSAITPTAAPYMTAFANKGREFTHLKAIEHPSLPNYLDMTSGGDQGCHDDKCPRQTYTADNIFHQIGDWASYEESMPGSCALNSQGTYAVKHNPAAYFTNLKATCAARDIPYPSPVTPLHDFTFVTPNLCNDMHDCNVRTGDRWLKAHVPAFLAAGAIIVVTFDEGIGSNQTIYTAIRGPGITPSVVGTNLTLYGLLAGVEDYFGVPRLGAAAGAIPVSL